MNRKKTREQNDISIIIGNLPKRLQRKIAEDVGNEHLHTTNGLIKAEHVEGNFPMHVIGAEDFSGQSEVGGHLEMRPDTPKNKIKESNTEKNNGKRSVARIPGILHIKTAEQVKPAKKEESVDLRESDGGKKRPIQIAHTSGIDKQYSPARRLTKSADYPSWFNYLEAASAARLKQLHDIVMQMMEQNALLMQWRQFWEAHNELQKIFEQLLLHQLKLCCEHKVDTYFWKFLYYNIREFIKTKKPSPTTDNYLLLLIENGLRFYTELDTRFTAKYLPTHGVACDSRNDGVIERRSTSHKFDSIAKVTAQKLLICLGDLSRYKVKLLGSNDYSTATEYYQRAQILVPANGIPYNQLAIVSIQARKKFDAVYFHMRSLMSSNAIYSAKESLLVLFDELRKKYDETELKISPLRQKPVSNNYRENNSKAFRKEVWIYPDGGRRLHRTDVNATNSLASEENRLNDLTSDELLRRFIFLYLYIIGKLYTGIGMENIMEHQRKLCIQLTVLLARDPLVITRSKMLKIVALNIFVLEQNKREESRREIRYLAFNFCNQMFGLILRKCQQYLTDYAVEQDDEEENCSCLPHLNTLLQFIKIYTDWLSENTDIWEPLRSEEHCFVDCWSELEQFLPLLQAALTENFRNNRERAELQKSNSREPLDEDYFLLGFTPLITRPNNLNDSKQCTLTEAVQFYTRISRISQFFECYDMHKNRLQVGNESNFVLEDLNTAIKDVLDSLEPEADDLVDYAVEGVGASDSFGIEENNENIVVNVLRTGKASNELKSLGKNGTDEQITQLSKLKKELEAHTNVNKMYKAKLEEILKFVDTNVYIEVRPKYLLPDTNCFIDNMEDLEKLSREFQRYSLVIPLTVVKELDGLSKGVKLEMYEKSRQKNRIHHFDDVSSRAKKSLDFIKTTKNNVKCATTKGSIINASLFALVEEEYASNDDKILATALALSKTLSSETSKDGKCLIQTELVLITTDRNLRVKALSRNLAVSELGEFLLWAKECKTL